MRARKSKGIVCLLSVLALSLGLLLPFLLSPSFAAAAGELAWTQIPGPEGTGQYPAGSLAWDGSKLYVGISNQGVKSYNPSSGQWANTGNSNLGGLDAGPMLWNGSELYASTNGAGVWRYNPIADAWSNTAAALTDPTSYATDIVWDGSGLYTGTWHHGVWRYDPASGEWTDLGAWMLGETVFSLAWDGSSLYASGEYMFLGGIRVYGVYRYDPGAGTWNPVGPINTLVPSSLAWDGSNLYMGSDRGIYRYDSSSGIWINISGSLGGYQGIGAEWTGGALYAAGPRGIWIYDQSSNSWRDINSPLNSFRPSYKLGVGSSLCVSTWNEGLWRYDPQNARPLSVTSISPNSGMQADASLSVTIEGVGFDPGSAVRLENTGSILVVNPIETTVVSSTQIICKFDLTKAVIKTYDVVVKNPDNQEARLRDGFRVTDICGQGAGTALVAFGFMLGLLSLAGSGLSRRRKKNRSA